MTHLFLSHSSANDGFVRELRAALADLAQEVWIDSRQLRGGEQLSRERSLAEDPALSCDQAAEALLLIGPLEQGERGGLRPPESPPLALPVIRPPRGAATAPTSPRSPDPP